METRRQDGRYSFNDVHAFDRIAEADLPIPDDTGRDPAMPANGVVATRTENILHSGTWAALPGVPAERRSKSEVPAFQSAQIDAGDDEIAPERCRIDGIKPEIRRDGGDMLGWDQSHLPGLVDAASVVVAYKALCHIELGLWHLQQRPAPAGAQPDPGYRPRPHRRVQQTAHPGSRVQSWRRPGRVARIGHATSDHGWHGMIFPLIFPLGRISHIEGAAEA
jgi:hypothetical protein